MRLRNVKNKQEKMELSDKLIKNPKDFKGKWASVFGNNNPIYIEIGMGKGKFIEGMAKSFPDVNFIGIERYDSVIVRALEKVEELDNVRLIRMNALEIEDVFSKEIDRIYLNFSDPWPKKRHHDRRLTSEVFLKRYDSIFKGENVIYQKTDNVELFEYSLVSLSEYGYHFPFVSFRLQDTDVFNVLTEYETRFVEEGFQFTR